MDKQVPLMNHLPSTSTPLPYITTPAPPSITAPAPPSWTIFFGLVLVIVLMGFFLIYLITKYMKQEKTIEQLKKKVESTPSSEDLVGLITNEFEHPMMRNVHALIETRLNDYDHFVQQTFVRRDQINQTHATQSPSDQVDDDLPPLLDETQDEKSSDIPSETAQPLTTEPLTTQPPNTQQPITQPPVRVPRPTLSSRGRNGTVETSNSQHLLQGGLTSHQQNPSTLNSNSRSGGRSMLMEALPSLISMFTGSGSDQATSSASDVTFPVIIGDIMTLMNNQQVRQRRREQMAPSTDAPPPEDSPVEPSPSASNNRIRRDNQREE
jgi:hypothetical protein